MSPTLLYPIKPPKPPKLNTDRPTNTNVSQPETLQRPNERIEFVSRGSSTGYSPPSAPVRLLQPANMYSQCLAAYFIRSSSPRPTAAEGIPL
ncbi:hypothetical protein V8C26DRAFT_374705 [Trichoderma gracile]